MQILQAGTCNKKKRPSGFTLIELIIVIFIISLLSAVVLPSFYQLGADSLKTDAKKLASILRYLNDSAIYSKQTFTLKFDLSDRSLTWNGPDGDKAEKFKDLTGLNLPSKGSVKEGQVTVIFSPLGLRENLDIILNNGNKELRVIFNSLSGRVKITEDK
jgi:general secretion pathway protein H